MSYSLVSTPAVLDVDADGFADVVYVGDLRRQRLQVGDPPVGEDRANDGSGLRTQPAWKFQQFFQAPTKTISGSTEYYKNIFQPPAAAFVDNKLWISVRHRRARGDRLQMGDDPTGDENNRRGEPLLRDHRPRPARDLRGDAATS